MNSTSAPLTTAVRVEIVSAVVEYIARDHGIRALHIKGPAAGLVLGLRRYSGDVDVLVEPDGVTILLEALEQQGFWGDLATLDQPWAHSVELFSAEWGMYVDLHLRYPGVGVSDQRLFELLWERQRSVEIAGWPCRTPDRAGHALLLGLHAARSTRDTEKWGEADAAREALSPEEWDDVALLARELRAEAALGTRWPEFSRHATEADHAEWQALASREPAAIWWHRMRNSREPAHHLGAVLVAARAYWWRRRDHHGSGTRATLDLVARVGSVVLAAARIR